jgi:hypothetical protein
VFSKHPALVLNMSRKVILPVWHNISADQIRKYSPTLSDRIAVTSNYGLETVVAELLRAMGTPVRSVGTTPGEFIPRPIISSSPLKRLKQWEVVGLIIAILSCIAAWLALPQIQDLFVGANSLKTAPSPTPLLIQPQLSTETPDLTPTSTRILAQELINRPIAFMSSRHDSNGDIFVSGADGRNLKRLTSDAFRDEEPSWSPNGSHIAFASDRGDGYLDIFVMNADGGEVHNLTNNLVATNPDWSPDGKQIAFDSSHEGNSDIYVMNADGSELRNVTNNPANDRRPSWSPDGNSIAFESDRDGRNIFIMGVDGSLPKNITNDKFFYGFPAWSPSGKQIAFVSDQDGDLDIFLMNIDGTQITNLTNNPAENF